MSMSNKELLEKIDTGSLSGGGLLNPEQSREFLRMTFEATPLSQLIRREQRRVKTGEIDKIAIGGRLLRKKIEDTDDNYRAGIATSKVSYSCVAVRLPWEVTEEALRVAAQEAMQHKMGARGLRTISHNHASRMGEPLFTADSSADMDRGLPTDSGTAM